MPNRAVTLCSAATSTALSSWDKRVKEATGKDSSMMHVTPVFELVVSFSYEELNLPAYRHFMRERTTSQNHARVTKGAKINREADAGEKLMQVKSCTKVV